MAANICFGWKRLWKHYRPYSEFSSCVQSLHRGRRQESFRMGHQRASSNRLKTAQGSHWLTKRAYMIFHTPSQASQLVPQQFIPTIEGCWANTKKTGSVTVRSQRWKKQRRYSSTLWKQWYKRDPQESTTRRADWAHKCLSWSIHIQ